MTREWEQALREGDVAAVTRMLHAGADVDAKDKYGQTGVMLAAIHGHAEIIRLLAGRGAALDHTAKYRLTALMLAVIRNHSDAARALVEVGADTTLRGSGAPGFYGKTALELARERGNTPLIQLLQGE